MADLSKIKLNGTTYNFKDAVARESMLHVIECSEYSPAEEGVSDAYYVLNTTFANLYNILSNSGNVVLKYIDDTDPTFTTTIIGRLISYSLYDEAGESKSISVCFAMADANDRESTTNVAIGDIVEDDEDLIIYSYDNINDLWDSLNNKVDKSLIPNFIGNTKWDDSTFIIEVVDNTEDSSLNNYII